MIFGRPSRWNKCICFGGFYVSLFNVDVLIFLTKHAQGMLNPSSAELQVKVT